MGGANMITFAFRDQAFLAAIQAVPPPLLDGIVLQRSVEKDTTTGASNTLVTISGGIFQRSSGNLYRTFYVTPTKIGSILVIEISGWVTATGLLGINLGLFKDEAEDAITGTASLVRNNTYIGHFHMVWTEVTTSLDEMKFEFKWGKSSGAPTPCICRLPSTSPILGDTSPTIFKVTEYDDV
jgi:hypothetical protein